MTTRHFDILKLQIEEVLRGKRKEVDSPLLMKEIHPLKNSINSLLARVKESSGEDGEFNEIEEDGPYVRTLEEFMRGANGSALVLNSEKLIYRLNSECEDLLGIRESSAADTSLLDTLRDQSVAATIIDLCDQSANNEGCSQTENIDIQGTSYDIYVSSLIGRDNFAKGFYVTFIKDV